jgi:hypothetical protein
MVSRGVLHHSIPPANSPELAHSTARNQKFMGSDNATSSEGNGFVDFLDSSDYRADV